MVQRRRLDVHWDDESHNLLRSFFILVLLAGVAGCDFGTATPTSPDQTSVTFSQTDLTVGTGAEATAGKTASVQYNIWLYSETGPDKKGSQLQAGQFAYVVGSTSIIKGFDMGLTGMKVGGVPPQRSSPRRSPTARPATPMEPSSRTRRWCSRSRSPTCNSLIGRARTGGGR